MDESESMSSEFLDKHQYTEAGIEFEVLHNSLRPGGRLLFTDYCCAAGPRSESFANYVAEHHYALHTLDEYRGLVEANGGEQRWGLVTASRKTRSR